MAEMEGAIFFENDPVDVPTIEEAPDKKLLKFKQDNGYVPANEKEQEQGVVDKLSEEDRVWFNDLPKANQEAVRPQLDRIGFFTKMYKESRLGWRMGAIDERMVELWQPSFLMPMSGPPRDARLAEFESLKGESEGLMEEQNLLQGEFLGQEPSLVRKGAEHLSDVPGASLRQLRGIYKQIFQESIKGKAALGAAKYIGKKAVDWIPTIGPILKGGKFLTSPFLLAKRIGVTYPTFVVEGTLSYSDFYGMEDKHGNRISDAEAWALATAVGSINSILEGIGIRAILKASGLGHFVRHGLKEAIRRDPTLVPVIKRWAKNTFKATSREAVTEGLQTVVQEFFAHVGTDELVDLLTDPEKASEVLDKAIEAMIEGAKAGGGIAGTIGGVKAGRDYRKGKLDKVVEEKREARKQEREAKLETVKAGVAEEAETLRESLLKNGEIAKDIIDKADKDGVKEDVKGWLGRKAPEQTYYISSESILEVAKSLGKSSYSLAVDLVEKDNVGAVSEAFRRKGYLSISSEFYFKNILGTDLNEVMVPHLEIADIQSEDMSGVQKESQKVLNDFAKRNEQRLQEEIFGEHSLFKLIDELKNPNLTINDVKKKIEETKGDEQVAWKGKLQQIERAEKEADKNVGRDSILSKFLKKIGVKGDVRDDMGNFLENSVDVLSKKLGMSREELYNKMGIDFDDTSRDTPIAVMLREGTYKDFSKFVSSFYLDLLKEGKTKVMRKAYETVREELFKTKDGYVKDEVAVFQQAFESYLMQGKRYNDRIDELLGKYGMWFQDFYMAIGDGALPISSEIKRVMDEFIVEEEEGEFRFESVVDGLRQFLSDLKSPEKIEARGEYYKAFSKLITNSKIDKWEKALAGIEARIRSEALQKEIGLAKERFDREYYKKRREIKARVRKEILGEPFFELLKRMRSKGALRWSRVQAIDVLGIERVKELAKLNIISNKGLDIEILIREFGSFINEEAFIEFLQSNDVTRRGFEALVEQRTDNEMKFELGGELDFDLSNDFIKNEIRQKIIKQENKILREIMNEMFVARRDAFTGLFKVAGGHTLIQPEELNRIVKEQVLSMGIRELNIGPYKRASMNNGNKAVELFLEGKFIEAFSLKREQLYNNTLRGEVANAQVMTKKYVADIRRLVKKEYGKYSGAENKIIKHLLNRFGFSKEVIENVPDINAWSREMIQQGWDITVPDVLQDFNKNYMNLSYGSLKALRDMLVRLDKIARDKNSLLTQRENRDIRRVSESLVRSIKDTTPKKKRPKVLDIQGETGGMIKPFKKAINYFHSYMLRFETFAEVLGPVMKREIMGRMVKAFNHELVLFEKALKEVKGILPEKYVAALKKKKINVTLNNKQEVALTKEDLFSFALQWGNTTGKQRVLSHFNNLGGLDSASIGILFSENLTKADVAVLNKVTAMFEKIFPIVAKKHLERTGVEMRKVEAVPYNLGEGKKVKGGYYPIKYAGYFFDPFQHIEDEVKEGKDLKDIARENFSPLSETWHGFTEERVEEATLNLRTDLGVLTQGLKEIWHDYAYRDTIIDVSRILGQADVRAAITNSMSESHYKALGIWVTRVAGRVLKEETPVEGWAKQRRRAIPINFMGFKASTTLLQFTGYVPVVKEIGVEYAKFGSDRFFSDPLNATEVVRSKSVFMREREDYGSLEVDLPQSISQGKGAEFRKASFWPIRQADLIVSKSAWLGAYKKGLEGKMTEEGAVGYADEVVRTSQGSGHVLFSSLVQTGGELGKTVSMFYTWFNVGFNAMYKSYRLGKGKPPAELVASVFSAVLFYSWLPKMMEMGMRGNLPDEGAEEEDWIKWFLGNVAIAPMENVIGLRDAYGAMQGYSRTFSPLSDLLSDLKKTARSDFGSRSWFKGISSLVGSYFGLPTKQAFIFGDYYMGYIESRPQTLREGVFGRKKRKPKHKMDREEQLEWRKHDMKRKIKGREKALDKRRKKAEEKRKWRDLNK